jgi:hypothetical protein
LDKLRTDLEKVVRRETPNQFDFFGMGIVRATSRRCPPVEMGSWSTFISFKITGEEQGMCLVAFEDKLLEEDKESMATEIANILSAKFTTALSEQTGELSMISPPEVLKDGKSSYRYISALLLNTSEAELKARHYEYISNDRSLRYSLALIYLPAKAGQS